MNRLNRLASSGKFESRISAGRACGSSAARLELQEVPFLVPKVTRILRRHEGACNAPLQSRNRCPRASHAPIPINSPPPMTSGVDGFVDERLIDEPALSTRIACTHSHQFTVSNDGGHVSGVNIGRMQSTITLEQVEGVESGVNIGRKHWAHAMRPYNAGSLIRRSSTKPAPHRNLKLMNIPPALRFSQGVRQPKGAARVLVCVAARHPDIVWNVVQTSSNRPVASSAIGAKRRTPRKTKMLQAS